MIKRTALVAAALLALWLGVLCVLDEVFAARQAASTSQRLTESLQATTTVGDVDLALVRGRLDLDRLAIERDDVVGHLAIDVADVRCELPPLGWALVDGECRELRVAGMRLDVSSAALFHIKNPKRAPVRARRVVIDDAVLVFEPSAFLQGLGRIEIRIDHAESHATVFRTPLSWLLSLDALRAHLALPANISLQVEYREHVMSVASALFGAAPVELPIELPSADTAHDAHEEIQLLVLAGEDVAERVVAKRAQDWIESKLH